MFDQLLQQLSQNKQRLLLRLAGSQTWCQNQVDEILSIQLENHSGSDIIRFGQPANDNSRTANQITDLRIKQYQSLLGQECDILIFDAYAGFSPDALGALAGTVRTGGLCILLTPDDDEWLEYVDPEVNRLCVEPYQPEQISHFFIQRLISILNSEQGVLTLRERGAPPEIKFPPSLLSEDVLEFGCRSNDQLKLLKQLFQSVEADTAIVVEADRGRGKSSALGLYAGYQLSDKTDFRILVSCPKSDSIQQIFKQVKAVLTQQNIAFDEEKHQLRTEKSSVLKFVAPDTLESEIEDADLVLIDEGAAIPSQLLLPVMLQKLPAVFATTIHGYEGTGRGFEYKFKPLLNQHYQNVIRFELNEPIRWGQNDMLEPAVNRLLAIDAELSECNEDAGLSEIFGFTQLKPKELVEDEELLMQVFGLLNQAHYRTSPQDLRYMLDGPNLSVYILRYEDTVVAASLVATEGQIEPELAEQIWQGRRRPKGHLFPQSLLAHAGFKQAGNYKYGRIVRIAVNPKLQSYGLGSLLLHNLSKVLTAKNYDFICTSFGAEQNLLRYWQKNKLQAVRWGVKPEASSGECSLMMMKPLSENLHKGAQDFYQLTTDRFQQTLLVEQKLKQREQSQQIFELLADKNVVLEMGLSEQDKSDLECFAHYHRGLDNCLLALFKLGHRVMNVNKSPILNAKVCDMKPLMTIIEDLGYQGEKSLINSFRAEVLSLIVRD